MVNFSVKYNPALCHGHTYHSRNVAKAQNNTVKLVLTITWCKWSV